MSEPGPRQPTGGVLSQQQITSPDAVLRHDGSEALAVSVDISNQTVTRREYVQVAVTVESRVRFDWAYLSPNANELASCIPTRGFAYPGLQYDLRVSPPAGDSIAEDTVCLGQSNANPDRRIQTHEFAIQAPDEPGPHEIDISLDLLKRDGFSGNGVSTAVATTETLSQTITVEEFDIEGRRSLQRLTDDGSISVQNLAGEKDIATDPLSLRRLLGALVQGATGEPPDFGERSWSNWVGEHDRPDVLDSGEYRKVFEPEDRDELLSGMKYLVGVENKQIRAVGSGHSHSNAPAPREHYVDITNLKATSPDELLDQPWLKDQADLDVDPDHLVRVPAGTILKQLNRDVLAPAGLALENMGSFDGQTLAGAINTATHGTGIELETLADMVMSVEMVAVEERDDGEPEVKLLRVEPSDGITESGTNPGRMELIQDDDTFYSIVAGYGCMGIAVAYTMRVRDSFWLKEESVLMQWSEVSPLLETDEVDDLEDVPNFISDSRHVQLLVNLPEVHNSENPDPTCLVRTHKEVPEEDVPKRPENWSELVDLDPEEGEKVLDVSDDRWPPERRKTPIRDLGSNSGKGFHPLKDWTVWDIVGLGPRGWAGILEATFFNPEGKRAPFVKQRDMTASYIALRRIRDRGEFPPEPPQLAISSDVAVPVSDLVDTVEDTFRVVDDVTQTHEVDPIWRKFARGVAQIFGGSGPEPRDEEFDVRFGSPMGIRFTAPSDHDLSGANAEWSAMVEVPFPVAEANAKLLPEVPDLSETEIREEVAKPALAEFETHVVDTYGGRPHLGKTNTLDSETLSDLFEVEVDGETRNTFDGEGGWLETYHRFNAFGTFDNAFTDQLGISNRSD